MELVVMVCLVLAAWYWCMKIANEEGGTVDSNPVMLGLSSAPKDGTPIVLFVNPDAESHTSFNDDNKAYKTIGWNQFEHTGIDEWQFAGWDWSHDCFTEGHGTPIGWLPF